MDKKERLLSIDVLRGMTIFFMIIVNTPGSFKYAYAPLRHASWNGCTPTDLVFPFFVFIVGLSMSYSFKKYEGSPNAALGKILRRTILIFLVGLLLNWFPFFTKSLADLRIFGVLQRIALAYGVGASAVVLLKESHIIKLLFLILAGYWALLIFGGGVDPLTLENNLVRSIDLLLFGEDHLYTGYGIPFDPEGLLSTIPAVGTVLVGYLSGRMIQKHESHLAKIRNLLVFGGVSIALGLVWSWIGFPINKPLWSSSYVLFAGGLAMLLLAALMWLIDVKGLKNWTYVFRVFGLNPLISYVLSGLIIKSIRFIKIDQEPLYAWLYHHFFSNFFGLSLGSFLQALTYTFFIWTFAWLLYRQDRVIKL